MAGNEHHRDGLPYQGDSRPEDDSRENQMDETDDDDQVIPAWPSRSEALARQAGSIQHHVYSLKDYSQVATPSSQPNAKKLSTVSQNATTRLLKSMSQDRKVVGQSKRMSECLYTTSGVYPREIASRQEGVKSPVSESFTMSPTSSASHKIASRFSMSSTSETPHLPARGRNPSSTPFVGESKMDRMRKLFVAPLSLRGTTKGPAPGSSHQVNPRLSFQAGASMLNKPHHLMHAMYRSGIGAHHNRRSPLCEKQGKAFRVYGCPLQMANNIYPITCFGRADIYKQQSVPYILARLCNYIEETSSQLTHEGIFRVSGNARLMEKLRTLFDHLGDAPLESESVDVATSASMLKMYLRELPEPLIPTRMNYCFIHLAKKYLNREAGGAYRGSTSGPLSSTSATYIRTGPSLDHIGERHRLAFSRDLTKLIRKLPIENYNLLKYLACFLHRIALKQEYNKMCAEALGIVFGPNVFRIRSESYKGLKEQELSNLIMASIISNYKAIFDSELTDPLGNLIEGESMKLETIRTSATIGAGVTGNGSVGSGTKVRGFRQPSIDSFHADSMRRSRRGKASPALVDSGRPEVVSPLPVPSTSRVALEAAIVNEKDVRHKGHFRKPCCGDHRCRHNARLNPDEDEDDDYDQEGEYGAQHVEPTDCNMDDEEDEEVDVGDDDTEDDDDNDDDQESYTPTSGSISYCSSMGSESIQSSYNEEGGERQDQICVEDEAEYAGSRSSDDCGSDTSYTPTSSHSESEMDSADRSDEDGSSSYDSDRSLDDAANANEQHRGEQDKGPSSSKPSCSECRRRESQRRNSALCDIIATAKLADEVSRDADADADADSNIVESRLNEKRELCQQEEDAKMADQKRQTIREQTNDKVEVAVHRSRSSQRRRSANTHHQISRQHQERHTDDRSPIVVETQIGTSDQAKLREEPLGMPDGSQRTTGRHMSRPCGSKLGNFRRRSSSASSLGRISGRRDQVANAHGSYRQPRGSRDDPNRRFKICPSGAEKRRPGHDQVKGSHCSSRKSRAKIQAARRVVGSTGLSADTGTNRKSVRYQRRSTSNRNSMRNSTVCENESYLDFANQVMANSEFGWNLMAYMDSQYNESVSGVGPRGAFYPIRHSYSDDMILRSLNYCRDSLAGDQIELEIAELGRMRRTHSGNDLEDKLNEFNIVCDRSSTDCILDEIVAASAIHGDHPPKHYSQGTKDHHCEELSKGSTSEAPMAATSFISLLDNLLTSFAAKSELSINNNHSDGSTLEDALSVQIRTTRRLIEVLERLVLFVSTNGYNSELGELISHRDCATETRLNELLASTIDYLSAASLVDRIEGLIHQHHQVQRDYFDHEVERLDGILNSIIATLRQRHGNLKHIRDHYRRAHKHSAKLESGHPKLETDVMSTGGTSSSHKTDDCVIEEIGRKDEEERGEEEEEQQQQQQQHDSIVGGAEVGASICNTVDGQLAEGLDVQCQTTTPSLSSDNNDDVSSKCKFGDLCPIEFVFNIEKQLATKRAAGSRQVKLMDMSLEQLQGEKLELQKNLLRYEHWFGRPTTRSEFKIVGHLYERYRAVKALKLQKQESL